MKSRCLLFFLVAILFACQNKKQDNSQLKSKKYVLTVVDEQAASLDTIKKGKYSYVNILLKLTNQADSVLTYQTMSCSWLDNFAVNNKDLCIIVQPCQKNIPIFKTVAPNQTIEFIIPIMFLTKPHKGNYPYQLSMELNYDWLEGSTDSHGVKYSRKAPAKLIWSNRGIIVVK